MSQSNSSNLGASFGSSGPPFGAASGGSSFSGPPSAPTVMTGSVGGDLGTFPGLLQALKSSSAQHREGLIRKATLSSLSAAQFLEIIDVLQRDLIATKEAAIELFAPRIPDMDPMRLSQLLAAVNMTSTKEKTLELFMPRVRMSPGQFADLLRKLGYLFLIYR